jgi:hypothetical protein
MGFLKSRKIIEEKSENLTSSSLTTIKPIYTTQNTIKRYLPSMLDPYKKMKMSTQTGFPYKFDKAIQSPGGTQQTSSNKISKHVRSRSAQAQGQTIDRQLLSPTDPGLDVQHV